MNSTSLVPDSRGKLLKVLYHEDNARRSLISRLELFNDRDREISVQ